jgi:hypothetical protein
MAATIPAGLLKPTLDFYGCCCPGMIPDLNGVEWSVRLIGVEARLMYYGMPLLEYGIALSRFI